MRLKILKLFFVFTLTAILLRLFYWQVLRYDDLSAKAESQHSRSYTIEAARGLILSSDGAILATNKPSFLLYGLPKLIKNKEETARKLSEILIKTITPLSETVITPSEELDNTQIDSKKLGEKIMSDLSQNLYWVPIYKNLDFETIKNIEKLQLDGLGFESSLSRYYPEASSAAHILGFLGSDSAGRQLGYFGVEGFYNGELRGVGGVLKEERDALGLPILTGKFFKREPKSGNTLILNLDRAVQHIVEKKLRNGVQKYGAKSGSVVVMEPKTGAVVAMASFPNYDPNSFTDFSKDYFKNPIVADAYEPGSTFKVLVAAAGLNEKVIKPDTKCDACSGPLNISGFVIRTWNNKYNSEANMTDVIVHSDNTGMVFIAKKLGLDKLYEYIEAFGFGSLTNIDLQDETSPSLREKREWKEVDLATASFGQGIAVTGIQMVRAIATIANGGKLMEPQIVKSIQSGSKVTTLEPKVLGTPISEETAKQVTEMMVAAVEKGEARVFAPKGFKIAGKTGTAQIPVAGHYDPNKTIASFVGFAPASDPKFVMLVRYQEPSSSIFGAETAAPTFFEIAKELFTYYGISPN